MYIIKLCMRYIHVFTQFCSNAQVNNTPDFATPGMIDKDNATDGPTPDTGERLESVSPGAALAPSNARALISALLALFF